MTRLVSHLARYGAYHRDRRNLATHGLGIPSIVLAVEALLSRPVIALAGVPVTPAVALLLLVTLFYLSLDLMFGLTMAALLTLGVWAGTEAAALQTGYWLALGIGLFVTGWIFQFVGHGFEGRRPAFVDDLSGLLIGPLYIVAELAFSLGLRGEAHRAVEAELARYTEGQSAA